MAMDIDPKTAADMLERERLMIREQLAHLDSVHREMAAPLWKRLAAIEATQISPPPIVSGSWLQELAKAIVPQVKP